MGHSSKGGYCLVCEYIKRLYNVVKSALHIYQTEENSKKNTPLGYLGFNLGTFLIGTNFLNDTFGQFGMSFWE